MPTNVAPDLSASEFVVVDVETTGLNPDSDAVVEIAAVRFAAGEIIERFETLVNPGCPIPPIASAIHLIGDDDVAAAPALGPALAMLDLFVHCSVVVAHNAGFDRSFLPVLHDREWICTLRFAKHLWQDAPSYKNQALRFWLGLNSDAFRGLAAHRATADALVTGVLFQRELVAFAESHAGATMRDVISYVRSDLSVTRFDYGRKYHGAAMCEIPLEYLQWVLCDAAAPKTERRMTVDADTLRAVALEVDRRLQRISEKLEDIS